MPTARSFCLTLFILASLAAADLHGCGGGSSKAGQPYASPDFRVLSTGTTNFVLEDAVVYPNPFLPAKGHSVVFISNIPFGANIEIFTVSGQRIRELFNDCLEVEWDGKDAQGRDVDTGIYLAYLRLGSEWKTVKIAIVR